ncbi:phosphotransferase family protein [Halorussus marinus]|uniref:phosphotransferase family protein n=1 Tax=Halorussus marinus TaxID=2505976 RepID=UPI001FD6A277|nr:phosphotransferase [Halorussus marinus]
MTSQSPVDGDVSDAAVGGMVRAIEPDWTVESVDRSDHGTDFVATLGVRSPDGSRLVVLKATTADFVPPEIARSEPRLLELIGRTTEIPVSSVVGYRDRHGEYPAPFYLADHVGGDNFEGRPGELSAGARERVVREAGRNLAELHDLGPLPAVGRVGVRDGELAVLDADAHPRYADFREWLVDDCEEALDGIADGGWYPDRADEPGRFADLVPDLRERVRELISGLPAPEAPTYCHWDYRYGNLLVDPETGATRAVLDWANLLSGDPAYNLATAESHLLRPEDDGERRTAALRAAFRRAYADRRDGWAFDAAVEERIDAYRLACRIDAMACLPLWHEDATPTERDERAAEHRAFVSRYL